MVQSGPRSNPRLSGHFSIFGLVFFVPKSLLGIARQWSCEIFAILSLKLGSHVRILIYRTIYIEYLSLSDVDMHKGHSKYQPISPQGVKKMQTCTSPKKFDNIFRIDNSSSAN